MFGTLRIGLALLGAALPIQVCAQSAANLTALRGLVPVARLQTSPEGRAALDANLRVTGGIQTGDLRQPTLLPFAEQQQLALRDCFITDGNSPSLADGLGTTLAAAYQARAHYLDRERYTNISDGRRRPDRLHERDQSASIPTPANTSSPTPTTNGKTAVSTEAADILKDDGGIADVFGTATAGRPAAPAPTLRQFAPVPDRAHRPADRRPRLLRRPGRQLRLQPRPGHEPGRQPLLPERPHHLRLHGVAGPRGPGAASATSRWSPAAPNTATTAS